MFGAGAVAEHLERALLVDRVALHQDALRTLGDRAALERAFQVAELGEAAQDDLDRVLPLLRVAVGDVGEDAALRRLDARSRIGRVEERDDGQAASWTICSISSSA